MGANDPRVYFALQVKAFALSNAVNDAANDYGKKNGQNCRA
jgi:hypothetical protein